MNKICIGNKASFGLEARIVDNEQLCDDSVFWGDNYTYGHLLIYLNSKAFGEKNFFYPLEATVEDAADGFIPECKYPILMDVPPHDLWSSFELARENNPDIDFYDLDSYSEDEIDSILGFIKMKCEVDKHFPQFLEVYVASDELSEFCLGIGSYCLNRTDHFLFKSNGNVRFIIRDDDSGLISDAVMAEHDYRQIWIDMFDALGKTKK
ncbi:MAG: hypothetical protein V3V18_15580 [Methylococcales bacterium]